MVLWNFITWIVWCNYHHNQKSPALPFHLYSPPYHLLPLEPLMILYCCDFILRLSYKWNYTACSPLRFLSSSITALHLSKLSHTLISLFLLIPLNRYTTMYLFIHQLKYVWVVSSLGNYNENSYDNAQTGYIYGHVFIFLGYISTCRIAGSCSKCSFNLQMIVKLFCRVATPFHVPTNNLWEI